MRIAFVGKGGSGKSTLTASFAMYLKKNTKMPISVFDADLNIHIPQLLGFKIIPSERHLSSPKASEAIKQYLIGKNEFENISHFRKTTPPTKKSNIIKLDSLENTPLGALGFHKGNLSIFAVGTYQEEEIGASCYHNNLSNLESILTHTDDKNSYIVVDMVAGVDSFAGTLHAQFDLTCLIVEPTMRSLEVYNKYIALATKAGVANSVKVIGNKIRSKKDQDFILNHIPQNKIIGFFADDEHIRDIDQIDGSIDIKKLNPENQQLLGDIFNDLNSFPDNRQPRLEKIWELHKKYISQPHIQKAYGDLSYQIDKEFSFES